MSLRFRTEVIVLHRDDPHPEVEEFCPSWWLTDDFDSDGDYYYDGIGGRWTVLELSTRPASGQGSTLQVWTFRQNHPYTPGISEHADLARYIDYARQGRYAYEPAVVSAAELAVTSLTVETSDLAHYREFLETVVRFLRFSGGVDVDVLDADAFERRFLGDQPGRRDHSTDDT